LDRMANLDLVRVVVDAEHDLVPDLADHRALLGDDRTTHDVDEVHASPPRRVATSVRASRVITRLAWRSTSKTLSPPTGRTLTFGRFRAARAIDVSISAVTSNALPSI